MQYISKLLLALIRRHRCWRNLCEAKPIARFQSLPGIEHNVADTDIRVELHKCALRHQRINWIPGTTIGSAGGVAIQPPWLSQSPFNLASIAAPAELGRWHILSHATSSSRAREAGELMQAQGCQAAVDA